MRILLTGKSGQLGLELARSLERLGSVIAPDRRDCDFRDLQALERCVNRAQPAVIVNAAAFTNIDAAEREPTLARAINTLAVARLAELAARDRIPLVHFSCIDVFDGLETRAYNELDPTNPQSVYGLTKCDGEEAIRACTRGHLILRTGDLVGLHRRSSMKTVLRKALEADRISVLSDDVGTPTSARFVAETTANILSQLLTPSDQTMIERLGTFHVACAGEARAADYARYVIDRARRLGWPLKATPASVTVVSSAPSSGVADRPLNARLDTRKLQRVYGVEPPPWESEVDDLLRALPLS